MAETPYALPQNLLRLFEAQDDLIPWALEKISETKHLQDQIDFIHEYMNGVKFAKESGRKGNRHTALCGLFMRSFEMLALGLRGCLSGSYHTSAMACRDLLETAFLIDFLMDRHGEPEMWLDANLKDVRGKYSPSEVRKYLDKRDGNSDRKRKAHYDMLSTLGAHPTPHALNMRRDGQQIIHLGPFKQADLVRECVEELAKSLLTLSPLLWRYLQEIPNSAGAVSVLALRVQKTWELYFRAEKY